MITLTCDLDEGQYVRGLCCNACCREEAMLGLKYPVRCFVVALYCCHCGAEIVAFDEFTEEVKR